MDYQVKLIEHLQAIVGKRLDAINLACEMMMFSFENYEFHTQCLTRIICENDILVTTLDYQSWDGEVEDNNDEMDLPFQVFTPYSMRNKSDGDQREMQKTEKNVFTSNQFRLLRGVNKEMEELISSQNLT